MVKRTDYVARACVVESPTCSLSSKCDECKKEIEDLDEIDKMLESIRMKVITEYFKCKIENSRKN